MKDKIDSWFDSAEKLIDRSKGLLLKIVGAIGAVAVGIWALYAELADPDEQDDSAEYYDEAEYYEEDLIYNDTLNYYEDEL